MRFTAYLTGILAVFLAAGAPLFGEEILPFEPDDTLEEIRYKIDHNGYNFTVSDNWVYSMSKEEKERFLSRHQPFSRTYLPETEAFRDSQLPRGLVPPSSFDWRDYNGHAYIGDVRDQGDCGSCYSFGAAAAAEGTYNYALGLYDGNCFEFSESYIIWCLGRLPAYSSHFFGCDGADYDYMELEALTVEGICSESDFPYQESDPGSCTHWGDQTYVFQSWNRIACGDIEAIKTAIMTYGVVDAAVYAGSAFQSYDDGIYEDSNTECDGSPCYDTTTNHAIALIGWDDNGGPGDGTGDGYWILRNSWGSDWGEDGYMRIKYNSAAVACAVCYLVYVSPTSPTPTPVGYSTPTPPPSVTPTPEGFQTPSPSPTPSLTPSPAPYTIPFSEDFEGLWDDGAPEGWAKEYLAGTTDWLQGEGCDDESGKPPAAHGGQYNALIYYDNYITKSTRLITPRLDFGEKTNNATLTFWQTQGEWPPDHDTMSVYYRVSAGAEWNLLTHYPGPIDSWTQRSLPLPEPGSTYWISFVGTTAYGWGVCIDDLLVTGDAVSPTPTPVAPPPATVTPTPTPFAPPPATATPTPDQSATTPTSSPTPTPARRIPWIHDFNGDGTSDIAVFRESSGLWAIREISQIYFGQNGDLPRPSDYNGNGTTDVGIFRQSSGLWALRGVTRAYFGGGSDQPLPGDYDGDGTSGIAIFRASSGLWAIRGVTRVYFGGTGDQPQPAYYDGGDSIDIGIFRPSCGLWAIRGLTRAYFGSASDQPVPGDYGGDGTCCPAIFRSSCGLWAIRGLTRNYFGNSSDLPVPADYTGAGSNMIGIFRSSNGLWAIRGLTRIYHGLPGDIPVSR